MSERSEQLIGIAASHGVAIAPAVVIGRDEIRFKRRRLGDHEVDAEWGRFADAVRSVQSDLRGKMNALAEGRSEASIIEAYLLMVGDETLAESVRRNIGQERRCVEWAVAAATCDIADRLGHVDDLYMRERSHDIRFVGDILLRALGGHGASSQLQIHEPSIVVAHDLSPADTAGMSGGKVLGFVTEVGSRTSHTSIMARALEIPAVVGVGDALSRIETGELIIVDGLRGRVLVDPTQDDIDDAERRAARFVAMAEQLNRSSEAAATTRDGVTIALHANIELPEEASVALAHGAEGVGLYRTEFLYVNRSSPPTEEEQLSIFKRVLERMGSRPVTLRTFDIGGDKFASSFRVPDELNPMLGLRAVRLALSDRAMFQTHLRAMVRASAFGHVRIMIPLVSSLDELRVVRELLDEAMREVDATGEPRADTIELGVMIEVPAAAMMADVFAAEADFMSIGTNDLVQYALAIDRTNRALAYLASPYDPAILRLIRRVIDAGAQHHCPVSVCGEMASEPYGALLLCGLGVRDLSMESVAIPEIKEAILRSNIQDLIELAELALGLTTAVEVEQLLERRLERRLHDLLTGQPESLTPSGAPRSHRRHTPAFGLQRTPSSQPRGMPAAPRPSLDDDEG